MIYQVKSKSGKVLRMGDKTLASIMRGLLVTDAKIALSHVEDGHFLTANNNVLTICLNIPKEQILAFEHESGMLLEIHNPYDD